MKVIRYTTAVLFIIWAVVEIYSEVRETFSDVEIKKLNFIKFLHEKGEIKS